MSASAVMSSRDPFVPRSTQRNGPALALALFAHALLIAALAFGVNWRTSEPTTVAAELWSATPQAAAPRAVETPQPPPPPPTPVEVKKVAPPEPVKPPAPALPDPQIAIEKAKREEAKRAQAEEDAREKKAAEKAQRAKEELAQKKAAAEKQAEKQKVESDKADKLAKEKAEKADAARQAAAREAYLKRMQGLAGATGGPTDAGTALRSSAPSASYAGRVAAYIKPKITLLDPVDGNPRAVVEIRLATDGTITGKRLVTSSGSKVWDDAVLRAIDAAAVLPRDTDGRVPPVIEIGFRPRD